MSFHRDFRVLVQGKQSTYVVPVGVSFESLDQNGNALNLGENCYSTRRDSRIYEINCTTRNYCKCFT
ncbi:hypothetical protein ACT7C5_28015 [Bacillus pacificus]